MSDTKSRICRPGLLISAALLAMGGAPVAHADLKGMEFDLGFPTNGLRITPDNSQAPELHLHSEVSTSGTVSGPSIGNIPFSVTPGVATVVTLPESAVSPIARQVANGGIRVSAGAEVSVTVVSNLPGSAYSYAAWPRDAAGKDYVVLAPQDRSDLYAGSQALIVASEANTSVTLVPGGRDGCGTAPINITLQPGQSYLHRTCINNGDVSGTTIRSSAPVSVIASHDCGLAPTPTTAACDAMAEALPPVDAWSTSYNIQAFAQRTGDAIRIMALRDGTAISINGAAQPVQAARGIIETIRSGATRIEANAPILVAQIANGFGFDSFDNLTGDPALVFPAPADAGIDYAAVNFVPVGDFDQSTRGFLNVVIDTTLVDTLTLDGTLASTLTQFVPVPGTTQLAGSLPANNGSHQISAAGPFTVTASAFGEATGTAFLIDRQTPVEAPPQLASLTLTPASQQRLLGESACVSATAVDTAGNLMAGVQITFAVTGANETSGALATSNSGEAEFCYSANVAGTDTVTSTAGAVEDASSVVWVAPAVAACTINPGDRVLDYRQAVSGVLVKGKPGVRNVILGSAFDDHLIGGNLGDCIEGGQGNDKINAGGGADLVFGGEGSDKISGGEGDDVLNGGGGSDAYEAGDGSDTCEQDASDQAPGASSSCETVRLR